MNYTDTELLDFVLEHVANKTVDIPLQEACEKVCRARIAAGDSEKDAIRAALTFGVTTVRARKP